MRALLRRVSDAKVEVKNSIVGQIKDGLLIYVGFQSDDCLEDFSWLAKKIIGLRIFEDSNGKMNLPISKKQGILIVSQFTLLGSLKKGYRPSFNRSSDPILLEDHLVSRAMITGSRTQNAGLLGDG